MTKEFFDLLLGDNLQGRKDYIQSMVMNTWTCLMLAKPCASVVFNLQPVKLTIQLLIEASGFDETDEDKPMKFTEQKIVETLKQNYMPYAMSVIVSCHSRD